MKMGCLQRRKYPLGSLLHWYRNNAAYESSGAESKGTNAELSRRNSPDRYGKRRRLLPVYEMHFRPQI